MSPALPTSAQSRPGIVMTANAGTTVKKPLLGSKRRLLIQQNHNDYRRTSARPIRFVRISLLPAALSSRSFPSRRRFITHSLRQATVAHIG